MTIVSRNVATAPAAESTTSTRDASDLRKREWGGWGSNPRPKDYESSALTG